MAIHQVHMRGADHDSYDDLVVEVAGGIVAAMSVGADRSSPSLRFKGELPNEDALSGRDDGRFARLVVADAHFGHQASEFLVDALHDAPLTDPRPELAFVDAAVDSSETTLTSVWLDRSSGEAQVQWFGDSLAVRLRINSEPSLLVEPDDYFTTPRRFAWNEAMTAVHPVRPGDLLVAFTDGVNECHYRQPETSLTLAHIQDIFESAFANDSAQPAATERFVRQLGEAALAGVNGNPGGQDNIAIVAIIV